MAKRITKAAVADALEKAVKNGEWGSIKSCPVCDLFHNDCKKCCKIVGLFKDNLSASSTPCCYWKPEGQSYQLYTCFKGNETEQTTKTRRAANRALRRRIKELRGHE